MFNFKKLALPIIFAALTFATTFAACGEDKSDKADTTPPTQQEQTTPAKQKVITDGHLNYTHQADGTYAISAANTELSGDYHIPAEYEGKKVTAIASRAFEGCEGITSIEFGANVITVEEYAFSGCTELESVTIPRTVESFGYNAFESCTALKEVYFGGNVSDWLSLNFYHNRTPDFANPLVAATTADKNSEGGKLYLDNALAVDIVIPESVKVINGYAFAGCGSLKSVKIPETAALLRAYAFAYCNALEEITIGGKVSTIGAFAFYNCVSVKELIIPDSVTEIGVYSFYNCKGLETFTLPKSVESVGTYALRFNSELKNFYYTGTQEDWAAINFGSSATDEELEVTYLN